MNEWQKRYVFALERFGNSILASSVSGISSASVAWARKSNSAFDHACNAAIESAKASVELSMKRYIWELVA